MKRLQDGALELDESEWIVLKSFIRPSIGRVTSQAELVECLKEARERLQPDTRPDHAIALGLFESFAEEAVQLLLSGRC